MVSNPESAHCAAPSKTAPRARRQRESRHRFGHQQFATESPFPGGKCILMGLALRDQDEGVLKGVDGRIRMSAQHRRRPVADAPRQGAAVALRGYMQLRLIEDPQALSCCFTDAGQDAVGPHCLDDSAVNVSEGDPALAHAVNSPLLYRPPDLVLAEAGRDQGASRHYPARSAYLLVYVHPGTMLQIARAALSHLWTSRPRFWETFRFLELPTTVSSSHNLDTSQNLGGGGREGAGTQVRIRRDGVTGRSQPARQRSP